MRDKDVETSSKAAPSGFGRWLSASSHPVAGQGNASPHEVFNSGEEGTDQKTAFKDESCRQHSKAALQVSTQLQTSSLKLIEWN